MPLLLSHCDEIFLQNPLRHSLPKCRNFAVAQLFLWLRTREPV